jgi:FKBP-type peptidyl-prolyl cis-trans isomerase
MKGINVAIAGCFALLISACGNVDFKKTKGGMPYKVFSGKGSKEVDSGNIVKVLILQKIKDSVTYSSYKTGMPFYIPVTAAGNPYDFTEVLPSLKQGDSLYTVQVMDTFIARAPQQIPPMYKKGDKIETSVKIVDVFKSQEEAQQDEAKERSIAFERDTAVQNQLVKDNQLITSHLTANNINAQRTGKGTYVQIITPGTGAQVDSGKFVSLKYTGSTFEGKVFDTNRDASKGHTEPLVFQVGGPGMIRGLDEGIRVLKEGGKCKMFIPSMLAYGPQPPSPELKPYENLIFDIDVLQVSDQPIQQQMPQMPRGMDTSGAARR